MCLSVCKNSKKPSGRGSVQKCAKNPNEGTQTDGSNRIDFVFDPAQSAKVVKCDRIVHVQFIRMWADGKVVTPGDFYSGWQGADNREGATTSAGWYVDPSDPGFHTPDYQQTGTPQVFGVDGKKNKGVVKATTYDGPDGRGSDKGYYDAETNPSGYKEIRYEFATFGYCMSGPDCGKWYEGITWEYEQTDADDKANSVGTSTITNTCVDGPGQEHLDAFDKFNKRENFKPCGK